RPATRLGSADRALAMAAVVLTMPGPYLLYQGEELGALDLQMDATTSRDPIAVRAGELDMARDRARSPMPWTDEPGRGFSTAQPWLPHGPLPPTGAAADQETNPASHLQRWRALLGTWRSIRADLPPTADIDVTGQVLTVRRGPLTVVLNFAPTPH